MLDEPVLESAPLAWRFAPQLCRANPATGETCAWLHAFWQCLRLLEVAATPERHAGFYRSAFDGVTGTHPRILVSGAADYSMLAHVLAAFRARGTEPSVTVIDVCDTPLYLNRWYAERAGAAVQTTQASVLDFAAAAPFDVVCTHSFFGQFRTEERPALIAAWRRLLKPGGRVVTAHPLRPWGADEPNQFAPAQAEAFRSLVRASADRLAGIVGAEPAAIMAHAERYLQARYGYPVRSAEELAAVFEHGGFEMLHVEAAAVAAGTRWEIGGPGLRHKDVRYATIVARLA